MAQSIFQAINSFGTHKQITKFVTLILKLKNHREKQPAYCSPHDSRLKNQMAFG
jgi:hypothetical protein